MPFTSNPGDYNISGHSPDRYSMSPFFRRIKRKKIHVGSRITPAMYFTLFPDLKALFYKNRTTPQNHPDCLFIILFIPYHNLHAYIQVSSGCITALRDFLAIPRPKLLNCLRQNYSVAIFTCTSFEIPSSTLNISFPLILVFTWPTFESLMKILYSVSSFNSSVI